MARKASLIDVILFSNEHVGSKKPAANMQIQLKANKESNFPILNFTKWHFVCGGVEMMEKKNNQ